jgi:hypothetical protein
MNEIYFLNDIIKDMRYDEILMIEVENHIVKCILLKKVMICVHRMDDF